MSRRQAPGAITTPGRATVAPLYDARFEHDACGVGFVADSRGRRSTRPVRLALDALDGLTHRGAVAADARTGDGAGIALPLARPFLRLLMRQARGADRGFDPARLAAGSVFLPSEPEAAALAGSIVERALVEEGLAFAGWREVPIDPSILGPTAAASAPAIRHLLVGRPVGLGAIGFERRLLLARRSMEAAARQVADADPRLDAFHVASLSARTIVFKGLFVGAEIGHFFLDLAAPELSVAYAVFHQRYSTNTHPSWRLAQPFRLIAHNGEINTLRGNREAMRGRAARLGGGRIGRRLAELVASGHPLLDPTGSDSTSLDEALELLLAGGRRIDAGLLTLVPEALELRDEPVEGLAAWQAAATARVEPWDGPAALVFADGRRVGALLDRNGLRPAAYEIRRDGLVVCASEAGLLPAAPGDVVRRGRLGPGQLLVVDTWARTVLEDAAAKRAAILAAPAGPAPIGLSAAGPRSDSVVAAPGPGAAAVRSGAEGPVDPGPDEPDPRRGLLYGLDAEQLRLTIRVMATTGREPTWSMGDDTPLAVLARRPRGVAAYLRQAFAQVTNPPIDPDRERAVMSLVVPVGPRPALLDKPGGSALRCVLLDHPVLSPAATHALTARSGWRVVRLDSSWPVEDGPDGLGRVLDRVVGEATAARDGGADLLVIDDRSAGRDRLPIPSLLAVGAIHASFVAAGLRDRTDLLAVAGDALDVHTVAMLLAAGADAVHPWHALDLARTEAGRRGAEELTPAAAEANLLDALDHGLRKVLARMGISTLAAYRGAQLFDVVGLAEEVAARCFPAAPRTSGAAGFARLGAETLARHEAAHEAPVAAGAASGVATGHHAAALPDPGRVRFRAGGELHAFAPAAVKALQALAAGHTVGVGPGTTLARELETQATDARLALYRATLARPEPAMVRDLLAVRQAGRPLPLDAIEPAAAIAARFVTSAMSLGALSPEAHRTLAIGMRRLGGASNTGEGGEDPAWYEPDENGELAESAIKQVASARFGVTARYLARAEQLEIKMAQGSKPGEGGQLPARKATAFISALRRGQPGMAYISPPPHHDIYSIEDLAQLIADLRAINPHARIGVKLVATAGVGTIAAGVAKAHADYVLISGHAGGTGASPLSSITSAGAPWELGLAEAHQVLVHQGLRDRVVLRTDGGLQTGHDVVVAALLGAEEFGFGTSALVAIGCDMARQCHLDTCPTGIATQRPDLRAKFAGTPEHVVSFFTAIAEDVRRELAALGFRRLADAVGRTDRLAPLPGAALEVAPLTEAPAWSAPRSRRVVAPRHAGRLAVAPPASKLDEELAERIVASLRAGEQAVLDAPVTTADRAVGARIAGELGRNPGLAPGLPIGADAPAVDLRLAGAAGQSLGAFLPEGVRLAVTGVANDYVAKGLSGGTVVVRPPAGSAFRPEHEAIAGNTCLYGATGGRLHLVGQAGMRFAVRNSGAAAVVEGIGAHGCEYMTGGTVVVLGPAGRNLGAGMTGGRAWLLDGNGGVSGRIDRRSVSATRLPDLDPARPDGPALEEELRALVDAHAREGSGLAATLLADWPAARSAMWLVEPVAAVLTVGAGPS